eukprot:TRINITY_DN1918_c0_g1_i1.p1 TRINITY_DN1918_c0_g1~~TRINITY_DN1918_c0_g1_i1.p1  ORF type:complete len:124 (-),score=35.24 TRINITY_DN1918_c0_g1_i1:23-394(-)
MNATTTTLRRLLTSKACQTTPLLPPPSSIHFYRTVWTFRPRNRAIPPTQPSPVQVERQEETRSEEAMDLIARVPPIEIDVKVGVCDGGSGPLGHPRVFINVEDGKPHACGYCGLRFVQRHHHH